MYKHILPIIAIILTFGCSSPTSIETTTITSKIGYIDGYPAIKNNGNVTVVVEIPAGDQQKWEVDKHDQHLKWQKEGNTYRTIQYLGYPANYGMIPQTLLPKDQGGDGDPLDVLLLGEPLQRGSVVEAKVIGVLHLSDHGEQDDKLIAIANSSCFKDVENLKQLNANFPGVSTILQTWFVNYKGPDKITSTGFGTAIEAHEILAKAIEAYKR